MKHDPDHDAPRKDNNREREEPRFTLGKWVHALGLGSPPSNGRDGPVLMRGLRQMWRGLGGERRLPDDSRTQWTPTTLKLILKNELPEVDIVVVSNREPYIHNLLDGEVVAQTPASGLISALEPVMVACTGTWIAHGSGSADQRMVDDHDRLWVPPNDPQYRLRRVWLSEEEQDGYYYGFSNEGIWPLCHLAHVRPSFDNGAWEYYKSVNVKFADAIVSESKTPSPIVLIQDYHFALLPQLVRERLPEATIITFWHIPWPNPETFGICPWREEVLRGLLGSSIMGFHTQFHCNNFIETVDRFIECRIDREAPSVILGGDETLVQPYPISIDWPPKSLARQKSVQECRQAVLNRLGLPSDIRLAVGIERFDYTKGILERMRAVDRMLQRYPEWQGKFVFLQVAAPTRTKLAAYRALQDEAVALVQEINAHYPEGSARPIHLLIRHHEPDEVFEFFRAADMCLVSSLHDGMNLVAKEFVAARDDEQGVLVLSAFAGASCELTEALIVNPYDTDAMALSIQKALTMSEDEQRERMRSMRDMVAENNVYRWAGRMLQDAAKVRRKQRLSRGIAGGGDTNGPAK